ncbi:hypothetical protein PG985_003035 [Apiospora marii]|uniref:uncharacterized protein n=1 Tax=Apiospora marii TaxID=335849 RepID=UPI00312F34A8
MWKCPSQPQKPREPWKRVDQQGNSSFMHLPLDVLKSIRDHLPPESRATLSLTCKVALGVFEPQDLPKHVLRSIRRQFEKHLGGRYYYCWGCTYVHCYDQPPAVPRPCQDADVEFGAWKFGFYHFQLVMNAHLYGPGRGLPTSIMEAGTVGSWQAEASMAILDGQLFLSARYTRTLTGSIDYVYFQTHQDRKRVRFCQHLQSTPPSMLMSPPFVQRLPELELVQKPESRRPKTPWNATGCCSICLTDYTFALTCVRPHGREITQHSGLSRITQPALYSMEIVTYHQLGACRTPFNWMWRCFAKASPSLYDTRLSRCNPGHPPGAVKRRWDARAQEDEKSPQGAGEGSGA